MIAEHIKVIVLESLNDEYKAWAFYRVMINMDPP